MAEKILLVDDDPLILEGYRRSLSREFLMETALGGQEGSHWRPRTDPTRSRCPTCECLEWMAFSF